MQPRLCIKIVISSLLGVDRESAGEGAVEPNAGGIWGLRWWQGAYGTIALMLGEEETTCHYELTTWLIVATIVSLNVACTRS